MSKEVEFCNRDRFIELGLTIASLRKMQGLSQEKLAEKAKISRSHLSSIEAPNIVRPFSLFIKCGTVCGIEINLNSTINYDITIPGQLNGINSNQRWLVA